MIRINLAAPQSSSKKGRRAGAKRGGSGALGKVLLALVIVAAIGGGAYYYLTAMANPFAAGEPETVKSLPPPVPKADGAGAAPSSRVRTNMAENVVKEIESEPRRDDRAANKLNMPYVDMTAAEKINYEVLFGRNALEMITRCTPPGIKFRSLEIENFQTIYASGAGVSRQMVQEMFAAFRAEKGELMPRPLSHIKDDGAGDFMFVITHRPRFGHAVTDPFQAIDHLGFRESVPDRVRAFSSLAGVHGFRMSAAPSQISVERAGQYRRITFKAAGMTTYVEFQKFVTALYDERIPCAFKKISMTPVRDEQVKVVADILFTVRE